MKKKDEAAILRKMQAITDWYVGLPMEDREGVTITAIVGDNKGGKNHQIIVGDEDALAHCLCESMVFSSTFCMAVRKAVEKVGERISKKSAAELERQSEAKKFLS